MPEIVDACRAAQESRTVYHVGFSIENWFQEFSVILVVICEIGVLHQNDIARGHLESTPQRGSLAGVLGLKEEPDIFERQARLAVLHDDFRLAFRLRVVEILQQAARSVGGFVVDDDDLLIDQRCLHPQQDLLDKGALVIYRDYDGHLHSISRFSIRKLKAGSLAAALPPSECGLHDRLRMQGTQMIWMLGWPSESADPCPLVRICGSADSVPGTRSTG